MKKMYHCILCMIIILPGLSGASKHISNFQHDPIPKGIPKILQKSLGHKLKSTHIGIVIQSMETGKILYQRNPYHLFTPASVHKLLTAAAALHYLTPGFVFKTQLLTQGKIVRHVLHGDLFIKFSGDPELSSDNLKHLIQKLRKKGIWKIVGHVYIDKTQYGSVPYPPGWIWDDLSYSYAAPLNTIIINRNYFLLSLTTPKKGGIHPLISTNLPRGVITFSNEMRIVNHPKKTCPIRIYSNDHNHYRLRGCFYRRWKRQVRKIAIRNVAQYTKALTEDFLKESKITYHEPVQFKKMKKGVQLIAEHRSPPLKKIIKHMLKKSDNIATNAVLKKLGETYFHTQGTWQNSLRALKLILAKPVGIDFKTNLVNDGAGLSRYNLLSPRQLSKVLYFAYHKKTINNAFITALPIAGNDGTMKYRLRDQAKGKRIRAKTGSMTGVSTLAGYIKTKHHGNLSFVIMMNGFVKPRKPYILLEDNICRYLVSTHG